MWYFCNFPHSVCYDPFGVTSFDVGSSRKQPSITEREVVDGRGSWERRPTWTPCLLIAVDAAAELWQNGWYLSYFCLLSTWMWLKLLLTILISLWTSNSPGLSLIYLHFLHFLYQSTEYSQRATTPLYIYSGSACKALIYRYPVVNCDLIG